METVNVVIRFRAGERGPPEEFAPWQMTDKTVKNPKKDYTFAFDAMLDAGCSQEQAYDAAARGIVTSL